MQRYQQLDSIRGLASLSVVFYHIMLVFTALPVLSVVLSPYLPLSIINNGHSAVIMFFSIERLCFSLALSERNKH